MPEAEEEKSLRDEMPSGRVEKIGPYVLAQEGAGQKVTEDTILLAEFVLPLKLDDTVIDIGTGTAVLPLIFAWKSEARKISGIEIDGPSYGIARSNVASNGLSSRVSLSMGDYRELPDVFPTGVFSVVVSNPPYVKAGNGRVSPDESRAAARSELYGTLSELVAVSAHLAGARGRICYVYPASRFEEMMDELKKAGLRANRLRFIHTKDGGAPKLFLIESSREGELKTLEPLYV